MGLAKKVDIAISSMRLRADRVFLVRNRRQEENEKKLPLERARGLETKCIQANTELARGALVTGYGLGTQALSQQLVRIQCQRIIQTMPTTTKAIRARLEELQQRLLVIGPPLESELTCKLLATKQVDQIHEQLQKEREGRVPHAAGLYTAEGEAFELELRIEDIIQSRKEHKVGSTLSSESFELPGGISCSLKVYPSGQASRSAAEAELGVFLHCAHEMQAVELECTVTVFDDADKVLRVCSGRHTYKETQGSGWNDVATKQGALTFRASVYVSSVSTGGAAEQLLCATLNELDEELCSKIDEVHKPRTFFSKEFGRKIEREARARQGSCGMPGSINQEVPIGILKDLRQKLPCIVDSHVEAVSVVAGNKLKSIIDTFVDVEAHPRLSRLLMATAVDLVGKQSEMARVQTAQLLMYEDSEAHTFNHYYMDIVQQLRKDILQDAEAEEVWKKKPEYLEGLDFSSLKKKTNAEQEIVDMQIKTFAYWKMMKKRLVDYLQLATRFNLSSQLVEQLKPTLMRAIEEVGEVKLLMAPHESVARERISLSQRIDDLKKADGLIMQAQSQSAVMGMDLNELKPTPAAENIGKEGSASETRDEDEEDEEREAKAKIEAEAKAEAAEEEDMGFDLFD